jgi:hypothetical protein
MWAQAPQARALPLSEEAGAPRRTYGVREQHRNAWGWRVSAYLWTKSIAAGSFLVPALLWLPEGSPPAAASLAALFFLGLTGLLLIADLRQPRRFLWTLTKPQWRSWLTRGSYVLGAYGALLGVVFLSALRLFDLPRSVIVLTALLAAFTALYTAFLFGQSKGRDLWQSSLLAPHLIVQALVAGASLFAYDWLRWLLPLNGLLVAGEIWGRHATEDARRAAHLIQGDLRFTTGVLAIGHLLPVALLWWSGSAGALAGSLALAGLLLWEHLYVQAPQQVPNA